MRAFPVRNVDMLSVFALRPFVSVTAPVAHLQNFHDPSAFLGGVSRTTSFARSIGALFHRHALLDVKPVLIAPRHQVAARAQLQFLNRRPFHAHLDRLHFSAALGTPVVHHRSINWCERGTAMLGRHGTNLPPANRPGSLSLARACTRGQRCQFVQMQRRRGQWPADCAGEHLEHAQELPLNARVQSDDPLFPAALRHDGHARRCHVIRRLAGDSRNAIHCYNEWTYLNRPNLPRLVVGFLRKLVRAIGVLQRSFRMPVSRFVLTFLIVFRGSAVGFCRKLVLLRCFPMRLVHGDFLREVIWLLQVLGGHARQAERVA